MLVVPDRHQLLACFICSHLDVLMIMCLCFRSSGGMVFWSVLDPNRRRLQPGWGRHCQAVESYSRCPKAALPLPCAAAHPSRDCQRGSSQYVKEAHHRSDGIVGIRMLRKDCRLICFLACTQLQLEDCQIPSRSSWHAMKLVLFIINTATLRHFIWDCTYMWFRLQKWGFIVATHKILNSINASAFCVATLALAHSLKDAVEAQVWQLIAFPLC